MGDDRSWSPLLLRCWGSCLNLYDYTALLGCWLHLMAYCCWLGHLTLLLNLAPVGSSLQHFLGCCRRRRRCRCCCCCM
jgi:hypothetical protein